MDDTLTRLGRRIRELRTTNGLSQGKLAELANVNDKFLGEVERGTNNISVLKLGQIANALGVDMAELIDNAHQADREALLADLTHLAQSASDDDLRTIHRIVRDIVR